MSTKPVNDLVDVVSAPLGDLIAEVGVGVANAQYALDKQSLALFEEIYKNDEDYLDQLRAMGYRPNWYQIPEAEAEIQVSLAISGSYTADRSKSKLKMYAAPMNAGYKNSFDYDLSASSKLKMKIVPVPEPSYIEQQKMIPLVIGKTAKEAEAVLNQLDIPFSINDDSDPDLVVQSTAPAAGEVLAEDAVLILTVTI